MSDYQVGFVLGWLSFGVGQFLWWAGTQFIIGIKRSRLFRRE